MVLVGIVDGEAPSRTRCEGQRFYDWAVIDLADSAPGRRQPLIRPTATTGELAYYRCHSTEPVPLATLVKVAGSRWQVEETFQTEKGLAGLDEHQVRRYPSWASWVTRCCMPCGVLSPAHSAIVQQFLRGRSDSKPSTNRLARSRGSTRANRPAIRLMATSNASRHRAGSMLWPAATVSLLVHTTHDDQRWPHPCGVSCQSRTRQNE